MSYITALQYTTFHYTTLHFTTLHYTTLYYTILYYSILYYTMIYCTKLYYTILHCTILYNTILCYTILYYTILYCTILHYTILLYATLSFLCCLHVLPYPYPSLSFIALLLTRVMYQFRPFHTSVSPSPHFTPHLLSSSPPLRILSHQSTSCNPILSMLIRIVTIGWPLFYRCGAYRRDLPVLTKC